MNKASIWFNEECRQFHLTNGEISYIFRVSEDGKLLQLYYGAAVPEDRAALITGALNELSLFLAEKKEGLGKGLLVL